MRKPLGLTLAISFFIFSNASAESPTFALQASRPQTTQNLRNALTPRQQQRVHSALQRCGQRSYNCEFTTRPYPGLRNTQNTLSNLIRPFLVLGGAVDAAKVGGAVMQTYLTRKFEEAADARNYSECQQVCFSGCLTADLIKYDDGLLALAQNGQRGNPLFDSVERKLREGKGVCTDFSRAANSLLRGLEASHKVLIVNDKSHAVVQVDFNNRSYIYEPQASVCKFFQIPN